MYVCILIFLRKKFLYEIINYCLGVFFDVFSYIYYDLVIKVLNFNNLFKIYLIEEKV